MARFRYDLETHSWKEIDEIRPDINAGLNGPIYCPEGGYFDRALQHRFESKEEKRSFMREHKLQMEGSSKNYKGVQAQGVGKTYYSIPGVKCSRGYKYR
uniref:Uncharacterized protein n=1 Tax=viral metagenome TaxID=1070528 RepID=A0A6M3KKF6_9ZZZZ